MYFRRKNFYQKSGKNFSFWNTFMIVDWKISFTFRSCIHVLNVERKLSKEKFNYLWKKKFDRISPSLDTLRTITLKGNMETRQMSPFFFIYLFFFSFTFSNLTVSSIHFWIWKCSTFAKYSKCVPHFGPFWSVKYLNF